VTSLQCAQMVPSTVNHTIVTEPLTHSLVLIYVVTHCPWQNAYGRVNPNFLQTYIDGVLSNQLSVNVASDRP